MNLRMEEESGWCENDDLMLILLKETSFILTFILIVDTSTSNLKEVVCLFT